MSKYDLTIDFNKFEVYTRLTDYIRAIQRLLSSEYYYYITGHLPIKKVAGFIEKLEPIYQLSESSLDKNRRFELDQCTVVFRCFSFAGSDELFFILMARPGKNGSIKHLFFEREKYKDARKKNQRISIINYEFLRVNKEQYSYSKMDVDGVRKEIESSAKNGVWTLQLTAEYKDKLKTEFKYFLLRRNVKQIKSHAEQITKLIGWYKVREDYKNLRISFEKMVISMRLSDPKFPIKQLSDVAKLPVELRYFRPKLVVEKVKLSEIISN